MRRRFFLLVGWWLGLAGCAHQNPNRAIAPVYEGPTETMAQVVSAINENNLKIPSLFARHYYEATIFDERHKSHFVNGDGVLLYQAPMSMRLVGSKEFVGSVFEIGSNDNTYWLQVLPEVQTLWIGRYEDTTEEALRRSGIPIRPDMVMQVLGVSTINTNFNELPAPTMRFNNDFDAYMFIWNTRLPDRWVAQREVWYDRGSKHPRYVFLFDENGRVVLRAQLGQFQPVEVPDLPRAQWPWVPTNYRLYFPDTHSKMVLTLNEVHLRSPDNKRIPNARSFAAPDPARAGVSHVVQIR